MLMDFLLYNAIVLSLPLDFSLEVPLGAIVPMLIFDGDLILLRFVFI